MEEEQTKHDDPQQEQQIDQDSKKEPTSEDHQKLLPEQEETSSLAERPKSLENDDETIQNEPQEEEKVAKTQRQDSTTSSTKTNSDAQEEEKNNDTTKKQSSTSSKSPSGSSTPSTNAIMFYGVTYLGCASVNAPKSESEINRIMTTLNEQAAVTIEVTMSMPQTIDDKIVLYDAKSNGEAKIAEYKMSHVLFVVRGAKSSRESACFAFTTCHGDSVDNLIFSCHVFRCNLVEAVSKVLYSFWTVFNR